MASLPGKSLCKQTRHSCMPTVQDLYTISYAPIDMTYQEAIDYLYAAAPLFQQQGSAAYKPGLQTTELLDTHFGHPHRSFRTVHIAGTNGKGSCAHTIAAILQHAGYHVGLYTSPHLVDFRERIRVDGQMISRDYVAQFVERERDFFAPLHPSFFEVTTALAFKWFAHCKVDIAVIEVGLGGRLDCTNIITPLLSVITNISLDHTQLLGHSLAEIATEKAGIIKPHIPVVVGEALPATRPVFVEKAEKENAPISFACDEEEVVKSEVTTDGFHRVYTTRHFGMLKGELSGECQVRNTATILCALRHLRELGLKISDDHIRFGFAYVCEATGLMGRWQRVATSPDVVCDTGHNPGGWQYLGRQLSQICEQKRRLWVVFGMAADKDVATVMDCLPKRAYYFWGRASVRRALASADLGRMGEARGLTGRVFPTVREAAEAALRAARRDDFVYIGGSSFVVADFLACLPELASAVMLPDAGAPSTSFSEI